MRRSASAAATSGFCARCGREGPVVRGLAPSFSGKVREVSVCAGPCDTARGRRETLRANSIGDGARRFGRTARVGR